MSLESSKSAGLKESVIYNGLVFRSSANHSSGHKSFVRRSHVMSQSGCYDLHKFRAFKTKSRCPPCMDL